MNREKLFRVHIKIEDDTIIKAKNKEDAIRRCIDSDEFGFNIFREDITRVSELVKHKEYWNE
jgi:hypothetical protein